MSKKSRTTKDKTRRATRRGIAVKNRERRVLRHLKNHPSDDQTKAALKSGLKISSGKKRKIGYTTDPLMRVKQQAGRGVVGRASGSVNRFMEYRSGTAGALRAFSFLEKSPDGYYKYLNRAVPSKGYAG